MEFSQFYGVVIDRNDPAKCGRLKVQIIGKHNHNDPKDGVWAQIEVPIGSSRSFSLPKEGEWVRGHYRDGSAGQQPVVDAIAVGLVPGTKIVTENLQAGKDFKLAPVIGVVPTASAPKPPSGIVGDTAGEPILPRTSRGILDGTFIEKTNKELSHVCDFISEMQKNMKLRQYMRTVAQAIRDGIRKILLALGIGDATGKATWAINMLKAVAREIRWFQKTILKPILDFEKYVLAYVTKMRAIIQWIMSLPARFMSMLQDCLQRILKLIGAIFTDTIGGFQEGFDLNADGDFNELVSAAKDVANASKEAMGTVQQVISTGFAIPVAATAGLFQPVSAGELASADSFIKDYEKSSDNKVVPVNEGKQEP